MVELEFAAHALGVGLAALSIAGCGGTDPQACGGIGACVTTVAGSGLHGNVDGPAANAQFSMPHAVAIDAQSNVHVADYGNNNLTRVVSQGRVSTPLDDPTEFPNPADVATALSGGASPPRHRRPGLRSGLRLLLALRTAAVLLRFLEQLDPLLEELVLELLAVEVELDLAVK